MANATKSDLKVFKYRGTNQRDKIVTGEIAETNLMYARQAIQNKNISIISIREKSSLFSRRKIKGMDVALFSRQLGIMMDSGINLTDSLVLVANNISNVKFKEVILSLKESTEDGSKLADSMRQHPLIFDPLYISLVEAGEKSGNLDKMLGRIATYKEKTEFVKLKIKKAIKYPTAILIAAIIVTAILMIRVIPVFEELFESFNTDLPAFTQLVIDISRLFRDYWFIGLVVTIITIVFIRRRYRTNRDFRNKVQRNSLKIPIVGDVIKKSILARFSRTLATVYSAGIPIEDGLLSSAKATANVVYEEAINDVRQDVLSGQPIHVSLENTGRFPNQVIQMVSIGESAGSLDEMLDRSATYYEAEVDEAVDGLTSLLEPVIMAVLGVVIGALIIAMYLPVFMAGGAI
ncbi:hypothetical protein A7M79_00775 [Acinetobacter baumannii]|uniref:type II secretion system F family protein n=1 Tax=Acinetobacter baumannii TaxID=470 RepID=UPI0008DE7DEA|nr:type II secretion system F family protein [Acinetobacter baumannii]OIH12053.1 hypothetical protein A7M79_00775 [Acinetobacter baumannii]